MQGEGARYADDTMSTLLAYGGRPLVRAGRAKIELRVNGPQILKSFSVHALSSAGIHVREVPFSFDSATGTLRFTVDTAANPDNATFLYEIVRL